MNYRHAFHAGNFADVVKHLALVSILLHLRRKDSAFAVIDTHAGRGLYDLRSEASLRTGEAARGIERILGLLQAPETLTPALRRYLDIVASTGEGLYPGSPLIAAPLLRPQDRLIAIEKHPEEAQALKAALAPFHNKALRSECADGYARLNALLPLPERRGVVLIDPPFESADEFQRQARALGEALKRFATGIFILWFPIKSAGEAHAFSGEVMAAGVKRALRIDVDIGSVDDAKDAKDRLSSAGLIIVNPPFGFADELQEALSVVTPLLSAKSRADVRWLAGEES